MRVRFDTLRKPALIFLNDYVPTPNIPDFKGLIVKSLQYEVRKLPKSCIKGTRSHSIWFEFIASDVIIVS